MGIQENQLPLNSLQALAQSIIDYETQKALCHRVDGQIIGTGKSDFTQGNVAYNLECEGRVFQLIDVPGIEGDESKFTELVQMAVAKAHLVFFVNGTNKKPEKATAEKIRAYLRRGSHVCPLVNVRGNADNYEFEEDRESLLQRGADITLEQTEKVLASVLGEDVLLSGHCVQGLMGFSSLAYDPHSNSTTIHPSRDATHVRQQRNYLKYFDHTAMYEFSQMESIAEVLRSKLSTFREDIVESNKTKIKELLRRNIEELSEAVKSHQAFIADVSPEFKKCRAAMVEALVSFERISLSSRQNIINELFNDLMVGADNIIEEHFGEAQEITNRIKSAFKQLREEAEVRLDKSLEKSIEALQERLEQSLERLLEDLERVRFEQQLRLSKADSWGLDGSDPKGWDLGLGDFGSIAFQVGSYATTGALIGSPFGPPLGSIVGGVVGACVGLIMAALNLFISKARRIRKSQSEVRQKIEEVRENKLAEAGQEVADLMVSVRKGVSEGISVKVDELEKNLHTPVTILEKQIVIMSDLKDKIEKMPYGTTETV